MMQMVMHLFKPGHWTCTVHLDGICHSMVLSAIVAAAEVSLRQCGTSTGPYPNHSNGAILGNVTAIAILQI
eukprot:11023755-Lingulodinium_polyedra.AAC.1